jgi:hypothetical protein
MSFYNYGPIYSKIDLGIKKQSSFIILKNYSLFKAIFTKSNSITNNSLKTGLN